MTAPAEAVRALVWSGAIVASRGMPKAGDRWYPVLVAENRAVGGVPQYYITHPPGTGFSPMWVFSSAIRFVADDREWAKYLLADEIRL